MLLMKAEVQFVVRIEEAMTRVYPCDPSCDPCDPSCDPCDKVWCEAL